MHRLVGAFADRPKSRALVQVNQVQDIPTIHQMACQASEETDQPGNQPIQIRFFRHSALLNGLSTRPAIALFRLADAQSGVSLYWVHWLKCIIVLVLKLNRLLGVVPVALT